LQTNSACPQTVERRSNQFAASSSARRGLTTARKSPESITLGAHSLVLYFDYGGPVRALRISSASTIRLIFMRRAGKSFSQITHPPTRLKSGKRRAGDDLLLQGFIEFPPWLQAEGQDQHLMARLFAGQM